MTREEAIEQLQDARDGYKEYLSNDALEMAIKALEQQPCDDAINRKAVYEQINSWNSNGEYSYTNATYYLMKRIRDIPSVAPQPKKEVKVLKNHNAYENTGILKQLVEKQNNLLATVKAWNKAIEKNGYVN